MVEKAKQEKMQAIVNRNPEAWIGFTAAYTTLLALVMTYAPDYEWTRVVGLQETVDVELQLQKVHNMTPFITREIIHEDELYVRMLMQEGRYIEAKKYLIDVSDYLDQISTKPSENVQRIMDSLKNGLDSEVK